MKADCPTGCTTQFDILFDILSKHETFFRRIVVTGCASQLDAVVNPQNIGLLVNGSIVGDALKAPF